MDEEPTRSPSTEPDNTPQAVATAQPPGQPPSEPTSEQSGRSGCRGCLKGCLVTLLAFTVVILLAAGWFFDIPVRWGLVASPAERLFEPGVNPYASEALEEELAAQGLNMQGVSAYVVASEDPPGQVAYILVDDQEGTEWSHDVYRSPAEGLLILSATTQAADTYGIVRVAVDHRDENGTQAAVVTAPVPALREYAAGTITQQELFDQMDGYADLAGMMAGASE